MWTENLSKCKYTKNNTITFINILKGQCNLWLKAGFVLPV